MVLELYPRVHRRYTSLAILGPVLDGYGTWLFGAGATPPNASASISVRRDASSPVYSNAAWRS